MRQSLVFFLFLALLLPACEMDDYDLDEQATDSLTRLHTDYKYLRDEYGRYLFAHGTNVSCSTKLPATTDPISYVGKPFPLEEADANFAMLRDLGFNVIRLLTIWEAVEPYASGEYDEEYLDYLEQIVAKAGEYGIYCLIDMHQDGFSRWNRKYFIDDTPGSALEDFSGHETDAGPTYNNVVQGDGAPMWALQLLLPQKNVGGPEWGLPRSVVSDPNETTDVYPLHWGISLFASLDVTKSFATFFNGRNIYPNYYVEGENIQDYLQNSYANAWRQIARRVGKYPNVLGYDLMNEPIGILIPMLLHALLYRSAEASTNGALTDSQIEDAVDEALETLQLTGMPEEQLVLLRDLFLNDAFLPRTPAEFEAAGFPLYPEANDPYKPDIGAVFALFTSFNRNFTQPFYSKVGRAIQEEDPDAVIAIESALGFGETAGIFGLGVYIEPMLAPEGIEQLLFAPHWYTDVYPWMFQYDPVPRNFTVDEIQFRDLTDGILDTIELAQFSLGNVPVIFGEFGTYFNLNGIEQAIAQDFIVPAHIINNYYDAMEEQLVCRTIWCYSPENTFKWGEGWNNEDFSVLGPEMAPRATDAYVRATPRFTSGKLLSYNYNSPLDYYEEQPGAPTPIGEFTMEMGGLETDAPTEIGVPRLKYPDGFYVYISDGKCHYDPDRQILYWYPFDDDPNVRHTIRLRPPWDDYGDLDWDYYFNDDQTLEGRQ